MSSGRSLAKSITKPGRARAAGVVPRCLADNQVLQNARVWERRSSRKLVLFHRSFGGRNRAWRSIAARQWRDRSLSGWHRRAERLPKGESQSERRRKSGRVIDPESTADRQKSRKALAGTWEGGGRGYFGTPLAGRFEMATTRAATLLVCLAHGRVCRVVVKEKTRYRQVWRTPMEECSSLMRGQGSPHTWAASSRTCALSLGREACFPRRSRL